MAGPDTTVILVSDHGFHSDHLRPVFTPRVPAGITIWHREQGVLLAKGPGIKKTTQPIYGARLLDIAPTILHAFGHPVGDDMEGRVLKELFAADRPIATIPTWEDPDGPSQKRGSLSAEESAALLQQFVDLGYIDEVSSDPTEAAAETNRENKWNLARAYLYSGKYDGALSLLEDCFHANPERADYAQTLARTQLHLGLADEAEETLAICLETVGNNASAQLLQASIALEKGDHPQALDLATTIRQENPDQPQILTILCRSYTALGKWDEALSCAGNLQQLDPDNYQARITRARHALHHLQDAPAAADLALEAIALHFGDFRAHAILGQALLQQNQLREAEHALLNALRLNKDDAPSTQALVQVYRALGENDKANGAEAYAIRIKASEAAESRKKLESLRSGIAARAKTRHAERQRQQEETARQQAEEDAIEPSTFTIVSGLPRSGTSLMMQMLTAAGMEAMTDGKRPADEDNLQGYFEWEDIKSLRKNPRLIEQAKGKVIKVISALLPQLPPKHRYRILFMKRPVREIVDSQWAMLARNAKKPRSEKDHLIQTQQTHLDQTLAQLRQRKNVELHEIDYPALVANPDAQLPALRDFLGDTAPQLENLPQPIRPELHRNR